MRGRAVRWLIVVAFAVALGRMAWCAFGPPSAPDYLVGGDVTVLANPDDPQAGAPAKQLYLRRTLYLSQRPRHAWIQVLGRDVISIYVNGRLLGTQERIGFPVGIVTDLTPFLKVGRNVVAIATRQESILGPPRVAVEGAYRLDDGEHRIEADDAWRCSSVFERRAGWWFLPEFDERLWPFARREQGRLSATVQVPPRGSMARGTGKWITTPAGPQRSMAVRRAFTVAGRPASAWLRLTTSAAYRLAINGMVADHQDATLGTTLPGIARRGTYDMTALLRPGRNVVSFLLTSSTGTPALLADLEVEDASGHRIACGSDEQWDGQAGIPADWYRPDPGPSSRWQPCRVESGDLGIPPWQPRQVVCSLSEPVSLRISRFFGQLGVIAGIALATMLLCRGIERLLAGRCGEESAGRGFPLVYVPLVPVAVAIGLAMLATYDPRVPRQWVHQGRWIALGLLLIVLQWAGMMWAVRRRSPGPPGTAPPTARRRMAWAAGLLVVGLVAIGFCLRLGRVAINPIQTDEVLQYRAMEGFWERGYPSYTAGEGQPPGYVSTSELVYCFVSLASVFSRDDLVVNRCPAMIFGTLTVLGLYVAGRRMFGHNAGLAAAALGAFAPFCIHMSTWGRYPAQLHFFSLLTLYCFWRTIEGAGPVSRRWLWLTAASFIAMYLTWEGSGFMAVGMVLAALWQRRGRLRTLVFNRAVWIALLVVLLAIVLQYSHRTFQQVQRLWYGYGDTKVGLTPMWLYPSFDPLGYLRVASWNRDILLPALGLLAALVMIARHGFQSPARFVTLVLLGTCVSMSLLFPTNAFRYIFHMVPLAVLIAAAALAAGTRLLVKFAAQRRPWQTIYLRGVVAVTAVMVVAAGSGYTLQLTEMTLQSGYIPRPANALFCPDYTGPMKYVSDHWQEGDVVVADLPVTVRHLLTAVPDVHEQRGKVFWSESVLRFQALLADGGPRALHRFDGAINLLGLEDWQQFLAEHKRVWCVSSNLTAINDRAVRSLIRQNMEVKYESFETVVLLRDNNHRTAAVRAADEQSLRPSRTVLPP